ETRRLRARLGERAREQGAAVFGGQDRDLERAELLGLADDLALVPAEQGAQEREPAGRLDDGEVLQRLARDLAERVARDERSGPLAARERLRDAHHQPPLREHLQPRGPGGRERALRQAERDDEEP